MNYFKITLMGLSFWLIAALFLTGRLKVNYFFGGSQEQAIEHLETIGADNIKNGEVLTWNREAAEYQTIDLTDLLESKDSEIVDHVADDEIIFYDYEVNEDNKIEYLESGAIYLPEYEPNDSDLRELDIVVDASGNVFYMTADDANTETITNGETLTITGGSGITISDGNGIYTGSGTIASSLEVIIEHDNKEVNKKAETVRTIIVWVFVLALFIFVLLLRIISI